MKHLQDRMTGFGTLLEINKLLRCIGLGSEKIADLEPRFQWMQQRINEYTEYPERFNKIFSADGWLAHDSLNFEVLKQSVDTYAAHGRPDALKILLDYYGAEQVAHRLFFFNHVEELRIRRKFIDFALTEHMAERHYSAVPLLLMVIDGAVNDAVGKGFHASDLSLDVWDSLMVADGAIYRIKEIFQKGRKKTRDEEIDMPYRNGILHGMDLGYANPVVTAKCWCFLFVVRDWILSKKSELSRHKAFEEETRAPALSEIVEKIDKNNRFSQAIATWKPRSISPAYLALLNDSGMPEEKVPEAVVIEYLALWRRRNYGGMARLFWKKMAESSKTYVREIREQFEYVDFESYSLDRIVDEAPAITEVDVETKGNEADSQTYRWTFRLIKEDEDGSPIPADLAGGRWRIIWIHPKKDEQVGD